MMNRRNITTICLAMILILMLAGCQLAQPDTGAATGEDQLIGVLVTTECLDLFETEAYLTDNLSVSNNGEIAIDGNTGKYQKRLYAKLVYQTLTNESTGEVMKMEDYVFEEVKGFRLFSPLVPATAERECYHTTIADDEISDRKTKTIIKGNLYSVDLDGTIYVSTGTGWNTFYFNPVYQSADGRIYVIAGQSLNASNDGEGTEYSQTLNSSRTITINRKPESNTTQIKITISVVNPPNKIVVLQMDLYNTILLREEYVPGTLPKKITPDPATDYIVVETHKTARDGKTQLTRTLFERETQSMDTFYCRQDGICVKQWTQLDWAK